MKALGGAADVGNAPRFWIRTLLQMMLWVICMSLFLVTATHPKGVCLGAYPSRPA